MDALISSLSPTLWLAAVSIALLAGLVKGVVGFAMPMVMISGLSTFLPPDVALAGLIVPTLVTNVMQALRQGPGAAMAAVRRFRVFLLVGGLVMLFSAQLALRVPAGVLLLIIGVPVMGFAIVQLVGLQPRAIRQSARTDTGVGAFAGFFGGLSGIWGPPTVMYLTALGTEKHEQMRTQGVIYGLGAVTLLVAHIGSGVLRAETWGLSVALIAPAALGMWLGGRILDRIDQSAFRRATLLVLLIAGLNLIRRAVVAL